MGSHRKEKRTSVKINMIRENINTEYWATNRRVKRSARDDKRKFIHDMTEEAEVAARQNNMKRVYEITRTLSGKNNTTSKPVKDKNNNFITTDIEQRARWLEHFEEILNRPPPPNIADIPPATEQLRVNTGPPTKSEIIKAIKTLKNGKATGPDGIPAEALQT